MKKKTTTPATTNEAPARVPAAYLSSYVLLPDGTPARRLKPLTIGSRVYYNLCLSGDGKTKRVSADRLAEILTPSS